MEPAWVAENLAELTVVDVREADERIPGEKGIDGSIDIPLERLRDRLHEVDTDKPIVAICRSGRRSALASVIFRQNGLDKVANVAGGLLRWKDEDLLL